MNDSHSTPPVIPAGPPSAGTSSLPLGANPGEEMPIPNFVGAIEAILRQPGRVMFQLRQPARAGLAKLEHNAPGLAQDRFNGANKIRDGHFFARVRAERKRRRPGGRRASRDDGWSGMGIVHGSGGCVVEVSGGKQMANGAKDRFVEIALKRVGPEKFNRQNRRADERTQNPAKLAAKK